MYRLLDNANTVVSLRSPLSCTFPVNLFVQVIEADVLDGPPVVFPVVMAFQCANLVHLRSVLSTEVYKLLLILVEVRCYACFVKLCC